LLSAKELVLFDFFQHFEYGFVSANEQALVRFAQTFALYCVTTGTFNVCHEMTPNE
jgi:hypothetical protein